MTTTQIRLVQGCFVSTFTVKKESIKLILKGIKDDIRVGQGDIGDFLKSLELHATAGEGAPIEIALLRDSVDLATYPCPFVVSSFTVKQDDIKIALEKTLSDDDEEEDVMKSLGIHSSGGADKPVELTLSRVDL